MTPCQGLTCQIFTFGFEKALREQQRPPPAGSAPGTCTGVGCGQESVPLGTQERSAGAGKAVPQVATMGSQMGCSPWPGTGALMCTLHPAPAMPQCCVTAQCKMQWLKGVSGSHAPCQPRDSSFAMLFLQTLRHQSSSVTLSSSRVRIVDPGKAWVHHAGPEMRSLRLPLPMVSSFPAVRAWQSSPALPSGRPAEGWDKTKKMCF